MTHHARTASAHAKINLALVVGPVRADGKHEVVTVIERLELADTITVAHAPSVSVAGFVHDTIVRSALEVLAERTGITLAATIEKRIPVAAGLGGGSSDAATALRLGNELLGSPLSSHELHRVGAVLGADVPFFLGATPALATGHGTELAQVELPRNYVVLLVREAGALKESTGQVYAAFDARRGDFGFAERRERLLAELRRIREPTDLRRLPPNDLASSPLAGRLEELGALRADVSGAGPVVYGVFPDERTARVAQGVVGSDAETWLTRPSGGG
jgi:4-diphosphocytidyl-2-C-methyl-D-erythritol kinase